MRPSTQELLRWNRLAQPAATAPEIKLQDGVEIVEGASLTLQFEAKRCIHARFCVTGAPSVFLANVQGPWIHPDAMDVEALAFTTRSRSKSSSQRVQGPSVVLTFKG